MKIEVSQKIPVKHAKIEINQDIAESRLVRENGNELLEIKPVVKENFTRRHLVLFSRQIIFFAKRNKVEKIFLDWKTVEGFKLKDSVEELAEILAVNLEMADYEFLKYKTRPKEGWPIVQKIMIVCENKNIGLITKGIKKGQLIGQEINASRELSNTPGGIMTPKCLASEIKKAIRGTNIKMQVLGPEAMKRLGMEAILGVAQGSREEARFIILEYTGDKSKKPIVLVGKGITFDTGGLDLKSSDFMTGMQLDMSGGAAVTHAVIAAAKLKLRNRVIGLIPAAENMPSGRSYRPGDILKSMSGKTIEVMNTDAEGRIILADALTYAERYNPRLVVDVATLTGAAAVALGERASVIMSKDEALVKLFQNLGEESGDYVWPLPLWDEYEADIKGVNADVANLKTQGNPRFGGTIAGGMFLYQFAKKFPKWMHIDMAPRDLAAPDEFLAKGSAGAPIRLLIKLLETYK